MCIDIYLLHISCFAPHIRRTKHYDDQNDVTNHASEVLVRFLRRWDMGGSTHGATPIAGRFMDVYFMENP